MALSEFARRISSSPEVILAPEYKVMQALRFTLDVKQPFRGLKGVLMELLEIPAGYAPVPPGVEATANSLLQGMEVLPNPSSSCRTPWVPVAEVTGRHLSDRVKAAYDAARTVLDAPALLTDAYFLYTPSQILLAALQIADQPLFDLYLSSKLPATSPVRPKVLATIRACAEMLVSFSDATVMKKEERAELEKKLDRCRDPHTKDLVKSNAAHKRDGEEDGRPDAEKAKRRKLERERSAREGNDLFGPSIGAAKVAG